MKSLRFWAFLACIAVLVAAFLFLDFHIAASRTAAEKNASTASIGEGLPDAMQGREKITVALIGEGPFVRALQNALEAELSQAGLGDIELAQDLDPAYPNPVLIVEVGDPGLIWTPFFATSRFPVQAGYASNGETAFMGVTPFIMDNKDGPALNMHAGYTVSDRSWGLISLPGYRHLLADYLAQQIVASLKELYKV